MDQPLCLPAPSHPPLRMGKGEGLPFSQRQKLMQPATWDHCCGLFFPSQHCFSLQRPNYRKYFEMAASFRWRGHHRPPPIFQATQDSAGVACGHSGSRPDSPGRLPVRETPCTSSYSNPAFWGRVKCTFKAQGHRPPVCCLGPGKSWLQRVPQEPLLGSRRPFQQSEGSPDPTVRSVRD